MPSVLHQQVRLCCCMSHPSIKAVATCVMPVANTTAPAIGQGHMALCRRPYLRCCLTSSPCKRCCPWRRLCTSLEAWPGICRQISCPNFPSCAADWLILSLQVLRSACWPGNCMMHVHLHYALRNVSYAGHLTANQWSVRHAHCIQVMSAAADRRMLHEKHRIWRTHSTLCAACGLSQPACLLPGCDRLPEALQHIFTGLGLVIKALAKRLAAAAPAMLKCSRRLRFHPVEHVRTMAASAFAFPLRHASLKQLRRAVPAILAGEPQPGCS